MNKIIELLNNNTELLPFDPLLIILTFLASLLTSFITSKLYLTFYRNIATGSNVHRAFPILGISITTLFICIQTSLPLSLGLLGALSFVRFRTPIKEPEEVGFIMLLIASSICCATMNFQFLGLLYVFAIIALLIQRYSGFAGNYLSEGILIVSFPETTNPSVVEELSGAIESLTKNSFMETSTCINSRISYQYLIGGVNVSVSELQASLRKIQPSDLEVNLYFNKPNRN